MLVSVYCGKDSKLTSFADLCLAAHISIFTRVLLVLIIALGNILIITTIRLVKNHHTPHGDVLLSIAVVDFIIGVVDIPFTLLLYIPETEYVGTVIWACASIYYINHVTGHIALDFLTLLCVERCLQIWKPIWFREHMSRRTIMVVILCLLALRIAAVAFRMGANLWERYSSDKEWSPLDECLSWTEHDPTWYRLPVLIFFTFEIVVSFGACILVAVLTWKMFKKSNHSEEEEEGIQAQVTKRKMNVMISLMFAFLLFWFPSAVVFLLKYNTDVHVPKTVVDITIIIRLLNSAVNAPIYAWARQDFRDAFRYLLTSPPWKWKLLQHWLNNNREKRGSVYTWTVARRTIATVLGSQAGLPKELYRLSKIEESNSE